MVVNKNKLIKKLIYFVFYYMIFVNYLCDFFKLPTILRYIPDLFLPFFILFLLSKINIILKNKDKKKLLIIIFLFLFHCILGFIFNYSRITYFIWGFRNIFRFLIIGLCIIVLFNDEDKNKIEKSIHYIFIINILLCFIQYFVMGYWGDGIGGTFRLGSSGGNSGLILLFVIELTNCLVGYINKKKKIVSLILVLLMILSVSVFAELKIMYILVIFIVLCTLIINKFTFKKVVLCLIAIVSLHLGFGLLYKIDPKTAEMMNPVGLIDYASSESHGYSSKNDISRVRAFEQINKYFFKNNLFYNLYGYGLGNCDVSSFSIFNSSFASKYDETLHYTWFSHAMLYLETGYAGYFLYITIFIYIIIYSLSKRKYDKSNYDFYTNIAIISIIYIIITFYNASLRNDISYFAYIYLFTVFILNNVQSSNLSNTQIKMKEGAENNE